MNKLSVKSFIINAFFPARCSLCGKVINPHYDLCSECENGSFFIKDEICPLCGVEKQNCICKKHKNSYSAVCSPFYYEGGAKRAVLKLKYGNGNAYAKSLANYLAECVRKNYSDKAIDEICFIPMTKRQLKERGFNQSELLANGLSELLDIPVRKYLIKEFETKPQHSLKESLRKGNVLGAYDVTQVFENPSLKERSVEKISPEGKTILLCDDIKTTGSTLNECAKMLMLAGAKEVVCVSAAITKKRVDKSK
jgi:ComF family protein